MISLKNWRAFQAYRKEVKMARDQWLADHCQQFKIVPPERKKFESEIKIFWMRWERFDNMGYELAALLYYKEIRLAEAIANQKFRVPAETTEACLNWMAKTDKKMEEADAGHE